MSSNVPSFGGSIPRVYDRYLGPYIFEPFAIDTTERIKGNPKQVLEIAAGTGRVTRHILKKIGNNAHLTATDLNPDMLAIAKETINAPNITWQVADAQDLPFEDNSFDCIICQYGVMFLPDKDKGYSEAYRVLKPGGQFICTTWDKIENNITAAISRRVVISHFEKDPPIFYNIPFSMFDPAELKGYLDRAGFKNSDVRKVTLTGESPSAMDIATGFVEGNPIINELLKDRNPSDIELIKQKVAEEIRQVAGDKPVRSELNTWVSEATK